MTRFAVVLNMRNGKQEMTFVEGATDDAVRAYLTRGNPPEPYDGFESIEKIFEAVQETDFSDSDIERLADEAERGYDVSQLRIRERRDAPATGAVDP